ncbi:54S ribosomal protein L8, mitochondrial [Dispira simplex]|nr:54S ribosomal protein L8, mitochondrial [Dispira simplex]
MLNKPLSSLGHTWSYRRAMYRNMLTSLIKYGRIETTVTKAKELCRVADKVITFGKRGGNNDRIQASRALQETKMSLPKVFGELAERYRDRSGGYTRLVRTGWRRGDHAPMAVVEFIGGEQDLLLQTTVKTLAQKQFHMNRNELSQQGGTWSFIFQRNNTETSTKSPSVRVVDLVLSCPDQLVSPNEALTKRDFIARKRGEKGLHRLKRSIEKVLRNQGMTSDQLQAEVDKEMALMQAE